MKEFKKYSKIYRIGHDETRELLEDKKANIYIEEKIDGGNFRFYISKEGNVIIGSRTQQLTNNQGEDDNMNKMFRACSDWVRALITDKICDDLKGLIFYGENCVRHTITYDWENMPRFLGFDIYDVENGVYLEKGHRDKIFEHLGLDIVPQLGLLKIDRRKDLNKQLEELVPESKYASPSAQDKKAEGIVLKDYDRQIFAKFVRDAFKEKNAEAFGGTPKYNSDETNNAEFVFKYCPNARIEKMIFKLIDEGNKLEMQLMKHLPKNIYQDIIEEEWKDILNSNWKLDFRGIRKLIPKRCSSVLQQMITNNALNGDE